MSDNSAINVSSNAARTAIPEPYEQVSLVVKDSLLRVINGLLPSAMFELAADEYVVIELTLQVHTETEIRRSMRFEEDLHFDAGNLHR